MSEPKSKYQTAYWQTNKKQLSAYRKNWYQENKKHCLKRNTEWAKKNPRKRHAYCKRYEMRHKDRCKSSQLKYAYGITLEQFDEMFVKQNGVCAICKKPETMCNQFGVVRLCVDHDHKTDKIRQLLCHRCNALLGYVDDNIDTLSAAIDYLRRN